MKKLLVFHICFLLMLQSAMNAQVRNSVGIKIFSKSILSSDTFRMAIYKHWFPIAFPASVETIPRLNSNNSFLRVKNVEQPFYISLFKDYSYHKSPVNLLNLYLIEPGDDVSINIEQVQDTQKGINKGSKYKIVFSGRGSAKYSCKYEIDTALAGIKSDKKVVDLNGAFIDGNYYDEGEMIVSKVLNKYKGRLSRLAYDVLSIDYFTELEMTRLEHLQMFQRSYLKESVQANKIAKAYNARTNSRESQFPEYAKIFSAKYPQYIIDKACIGKYKNGNSKTIKSDSIENTYQLLKQVYPGELGDKVVTFFVLNSFNSKLGEELLQDAAASLRTEYCISELGRFANANAIGKQAYDFSLPDSSGKLVKLSDFIGKVIFIDFWFNGCRGCMQYYSDVISKAEKNLALNPGVIFIAINVDPDRKRWMDGIYSDKYTSASVVNLNTNGEGSSHPVISNYWIDTYPQALVIGKDGKIFSNTVYELREGGVTKLSEVINRALLAGTE